MCWLGGVELLEPGGVVDLLAGPLAAGLQVVERAGYHSRGGPPTAAGTAGAAGTGGLVNWLPEERWHEDPGFGTVHGVVEG